MQVTLGKRAEKKSTQLEQLHTYLVNTVQWPECKREYHTFKKTLQSAELRQYQDEIASLTTIEGQSFASVGRYFSLDKGSIQNWKRQRNQKEKKVENERKVAQLQGAFHLSKA